MTEPSGRPLWGLPRPVVALGALAIIVIVAAGVSVGLGGGLPGSGHPVSPHAVASVAPASHEPQRRFRQLAGAQQRPTGRDPHRIRAAHRA